MLPLKSELSALTQRIISEEFHYNDLRMATHALKDLFCQAVGFDEQESAKQKHIQSGGGQAISTYTAALCITDMMRTRKFLRGLKNAIDDILMDSPGEPVIVFYAGAGPFATLVTPLTTLYTPGELKFALLEINPSSIDYLKKTIEKFELDKYVLGVEEADAVHYLIPENFQPHILLSETMKPALEKEPQINIIANLYRQCREGTILIPESIRVDAVLVGNMAMEPMPIKPIATLIDLNEFTATEPQNEPAIAGVQIDLKEMPAAEFSRICLNTEVRVYGEEVLGLQESGITLLVPGISLSDIESYPAKILFEYKMDANPRFTVTIL